MKDVQSTATIAATDSAGNSASTSATAPAITTTWQRGRDGQVGETRISLGIGSYQLRINTRKRPGAKGIQCRATVVTPHADGGGFTHVLDFGNEGDYSVTIAVDAIRSAAEKNLREMHAGAIRDVDRILALARAHYGSRAPSIGA